MKRSRFIKRHGFTLMEMMVVIVVISILVGLLIPAILKAKEGAREKKARTEIHELQKAWAMYIQFYQEQDGDNFNMPTHDEMSPTATKDLGADGGNNNGGIVFMEFTRDELDNGFFDPWKVPYKLEFVKPGNVTTEWIYQTRVQCKNASRGKY